MGVAEILQHQGLWDLGGEGWVGLFLHCDGSILMQEKDRVYDTGAAIVPPYIAEIEPKIRNRKIIFTI